VVVVDPDVVGLLTDLDAITYDPYIDVIATRYVLDVDGRPLIGSLLARLAHGLLLSHD